MEARLYYVLLTVLMTKKRNPLKNLSLNDKYYSHKTRIKELISKY
jgi:hypothetical protein